MKRILLAVTFALAVSSFSSVVLAVAHDASGTLSLSKYFVVYDDEPAPPQTPAPEPTPAPPPEPKPY